MSLRGITGYETDALRIAVQSLASMTRVERVSETKKQMREDVDTMLTLIRYAESGRLMLNDPLPPIKPLTERIVAKNVA
jgi:hypothetical protein